MNKKILLFNSHHLNWRDLLVWPSESQREELKKRTHFLSLCSLLENDYFLSEKHVSKIRYISFDLHVAVAAPCCPVQ